MTTQKHLPQVQNHRDDLDTALSFPGEAELTPAKIVAELGKHIISQDEAKRAVAIALRNRYRRRQVTGELKEEIYPKNILMIGNTGVGKTEIARRLAKLTKAPFIKVEATKFSQIGYVGRDVEGIIRDLMTQAVSNERALMLTALETKATKEAEEIILNALLPESAVLAGPAHIPHAPADTAIDALSLSLNLASKNNNPTTMQTPSGASSQEKETAAVQAKQFKETREKLRTKLHAGELEDRFIELLITTPQEGPGTLQISGMHLMDQQLEGLQNMMKNFGGMFKAKKNKQRIRIRDARPQIVAQVSDRMLDMNSVITRAKEKTEKMGIVFVDEIDKIVSKSGEKHGSIDVSREGVQRDLLPLVEGSSVSTPHGIIQTDHILFIAAGAFHISSPSDMIPELQGRFPIRVKLIPLKAAELVQILKEPKNSLTRQYHALMKSEGIELKFQNQAINEIAQSAERVNTESENIGARRLATLMEKLLEELLFYGNDLASLKAQTSLQIKGNTVTITETYVKNRFADILPDEDLSRYIL